MLNLLSKKIHVWLGASVGLNLALIWAGYGFWWTDRQIPRVGEESENATMGMMRPTTQASSRVKSMCWDDLASRDYRKLISNLRSFRCPEATVQDIIIGAVNRYYGPRLTGLKRGLTRFWEPVQRHTLSENDFKAEQERNQEVHRLEAERDQLVFELLGVSTSELLANAGGAERFEDFLSALPAESRTRARDILQRFDNLEADITARTGGAIGATEQKELNQLYRSRIAELKQFLPPQDLEEYEVRYSPTANLMRQLNLVGFSPSELEFRAIFKAMNAFQAQFPAENPIGSGFGGIAAGSDVMQAAQDRDEQIRQALGEVRYAEYKRSNDATYRGLIELTDHYGVSQDVAAQIHGLREAVLSQSRAINKDQGLSEDQRNIALQEIRQETAKAVNSALGEEAYQSYVNLSIGRWIDDITRIPE